MPAGVVPLPPPSAEEGFGSPRGISPGDHDGDGRVDLAFGLRGLVVGDSDLRPGATFQSFQGAAGFAAGPVVISEASPTRLASGDLDGDGRTDVAVAGEPVGGGEAGFLPPAFWVDYQGPEPDVRQVLGFDPVADIAVADANGDGRLDLLATRNVGGAPTLFIYRDHDPATGRLTGTPVSVALGVAGTGLRIAAGDVTGDGLADVVVALGGAAGAVLLVRDPAADGGFAAPVAIAIEGASSVAVGDLDGDGRLDVAVARGGAALPADRRRIAILRQDAGGRLARVASDLDALAPVVAVSIADLNGDGRADVLVQTGSPNAVVVFERR